MNIVVGVLVGLLVLMILVIAHELGHFWMARRNGVEVEEFGVGFPPRAIAWQKRDGKWRRIKEAEREKSRGKGLIVSLNWLPIGGFCKMKDENDAATAKGSFGSATLWGKTKILFGGVAMNWGVAAVIFTGLALTGMPHFIGNQFVVESDVSVEASPVVINEVVEGSPAEVAGLRAGDEIFAMCEKENCVRVEQPSGVSDFNERHAGQQITLQYSRGSESLQSIELKLNERGGEYLLGVAMEQDGLPLRRSTWSAPIVGVATTVQLTGETFKGLGQLVWNLVSGIAMQISPNSEVREQGAVNIEQVGDSVSGPVGIIGYLFPAFASLGMTYLLYFAAIISVSLACMNVLPIPALDGGRWLLIMIYRLRGKKLTMEIEEKIVSRAFMVLMGLILAITVLDITKFFG